MTVYMGKGVVSPGETQRERSRKNAELVHLGVEQVLTPNDLYTNQMAMLAAFSRAGVDDEDWCHLRDCDDGGCPNTACSAACWFGERAAAGKMIVEAAEILQSTQKPLYFVTVIDPQYRRPIGRLNAFSFSAAKQAIWRRFRSAEILATDPAVGFMEVCIVSGADGRREWMLHFHFVIASNASKKLIRKAFRPALQNIASDFTGRRLRPVVVKPVNRIFNLFGYITKRKLEVADHSMARRAAGKSGGRVSASERLELDQWLLKQVPLDRLFLRGVKRVHGRLTLFRSHR